MITLKHWLETVKYQISEGSDYYPFGMSPPFIKQSDKRKHDKFFCLDVNKEHAGASVVFNTETQEVIQATVFDYENERAYRISSPKFYEGVCKKFLDESAWDDVLFTDLEIVGDFIDKTTKILAGEEYDTDVEVQIDIDDKTAFELMKMAHEQNITFNQLVNNMTRKELERLGNV